MDPLLDHDEDGGSFEAYFRAPALAAQAPLAWALGQRLDLLDALRSLFSGPRHVVQLRLWCFLELASTPKGRVARDDLNLLFHALQPQALENALKRLREAGLLVWDATQQDYALSDLARQVHSLLAPLTQAASEDDDLAGLLAQVAGAQALGLADATQLKHLHAQLARLHDEFADAIASGSEARLRQAQPRFARALALVERAGQALTALIRSDSGDVRLEREARALGHAQARLLSMASQFNRAMQQADRQRVTLGSTGVTSSDVRDWLREHAALSALLDGALAQGVQPWLLSQHDVLDVAEAEFERDRPDPQRSSALPPPTNAAGGALDVPSLPEELHGLIGLLAQWQASAQQAGPADAQPDTQPDGPAAAPPRPLHEAVLGGRFAQAAYRMQLLPLLGDAQAQTLKGQTGELARSGWRASLSPRVLPVQHHAVQAMSEGCLHPEQSPPPPWPAVALPTAQAAQQATAAGPRRGRPPRKNSSKP
ncbi:hypothetical protein [Vandammella animalimorsus]|uniref:hypothetical protein n=1 Tax=Vandammella animalimorsus TaxID=2029117 RepID=UPI001EEEB5F6|nr:hypothetical protein [Vandammella animalimorsus]